MIAVGPIVSIAVALQFATSPPVGGSKAATPSGVAALKGLMAQMAQTRGAMIQVLRSSRQWKGQPMVPDSVYTLWYDDPGRFRVMRSGIMGGGGLYISDGKTLLFDPLDDTQDQTLSATAVDIGAALTPKGNGPEFRGSAMPVFFLLMSGSGAFGRLVDDSSPVIANESEISFKSNDVGKVKVVLTGKGQSLKVLRVEYDNLPSYERRGRFGRSGGSTPDDPLTVEEISYMGEHQKMDPALFAVEPHKESPVRDLRKKSDSASAGRIQPLLKGL